MRLIAESRPDVIVSTYPNVTEVLGRLRRSGRLRIPVCAAITDLAALDYWASAGVDLHLVTHPESIPEVRRIAGAATEIHCVHGFTRPEFRVRWRPRARAALGLPAEGRGRARLGRWMGRRRRARRGRRGAGLEECRARSLPLRAQRVPQAPRVGGLRSATLACASRASPIACPSGWLPPTSSFTRPVASRCSRRSCADCRPSRTGGVAGTSGETTRLYAASASPRSWRRARSCASAMSRAFARKRRVDPRFASLPSAASFVLELADRPRSPQAG